MLEFVTDPVVRILADDSFEVVEDFIVKYYDWTFVIDAGFRTDLASVPRLPVVYLLFGDRAKKAAIFHDWLYTVKIMSRLESDVAFMDAMEVQGLDLATRRAMYRGVRLGGGLRWSD